MAKKTRSRIAELRQKPSQHTRTSGGLLRKTAYFTEEEWAEIRQIAFEAEVTYADIIRRAIREYVGLGDRNMARRRGEKRT